MRTIKAPWNTHYPLGMSSAYRWMNCPGLYQVMLTAEKRAERPNPAADRGTAIHFATEFCARMDLAASEFPYESVEVNGEEYQIGDEEREIIALVQSTLIDLAGTGGEWSVEQKIEVSKVCGGTADGVAWNAQSVSVIDLKTGHKRVEVGQNPQLLGYLFGLSLRPEHAAKKVFKAVIVQPTAKPKVTTQSYSRAEVEAFGVTLLKAVADCEKKSAKCVPGEWCEWCQHTTCQARAKEIQKVAAQAFSPVPPAPEQMSKADIVKLLGWKDQIVEFLDAIGVYAHEQAEKGEKWQGYKLVQKKANRQWGDEAMVEAALTQVLGQDAAFTRKMLSPAQAEKALKKAGKGADIVEKYSVKPTTGTVLVPTSDPRPAVGGGAAAAFAAADNANLLG